MKIWQIAAGEPNRFYDDLFLRYGIMLLGPSHLGDATKNKYSQGRGVSSMDQVHAFAHRPKPGDRVLIRKRTEVAAIGQIPEDGGYSFQSSFGCVLGWDLCHTWRVAWATKPSLISSMPNPFANIKQYPSFTEVHHKGAVNFVKSLPADVFSESLPPLPDAAYGQLSYDDLRLELFKRGVSAASTEALIAALRQCHQLADWYNQDGVANQRPTEYEVVSHMVLPLLLSLGWSHQQVAVEWNRVDMALFLRTPTNAENCVGIVEAKGIGQSLGKVFSQPKTYIDRLKLKNVRKVIITDGANFFIHNRKKDGTYGDQPDGYFNVRHLARRYVVPEGTSAVDALVQLLPSQF